MASRSDSTHLANYVYFRPMPERVVCLLFSFCFSLAVWGQNHFFQASDSLNKPRLITTSAVIGTVWTGSLVGLSQVWYKDFEKTGFHSFDDSKEWLQMDKMGHVFTAYHLSDKVFKLYRWTGLSRRKSAWIGAGVGWGYQFSFEMLDARSSGWGFSWSDVTANTIGSGLFLTQELLWQEQYLKLKFSYSPSPYAQYRPNVLGSSPTERLLKDYNGQTYWLSISPGAVFKNSHIPPWIAISAGYSADAKLVGHSDFFQTPDGSKTFHAQREFALSLDVDVTKLNIKKRWIKKALSPFNVIKVPFPALVWRGNTLYGKWLYF